MKSSTAPHLAHQEINRALLRHVVSNHLQLYQCLGVAFHRHQHVGTVEGCLAEAAAAAAETAQAAAAAAAAVGNISPARSEVWGDRKERGKGGGRPHAMLLVQGGGGGGVLISRMAVVVRPQTLAPPTIPGASPCRDRTSVRGGDGVRDEERGSPAAMPWLRGAFSLSKPCILEAQISAVLFTA